MTGKDLENLQSGTPAVWRIKAEKAANAVLAEIPDTDGDRADTREEILARAVKRLLVVPGLIPLRAEQADVKVLAAEAIRRAQRELDYYIKEQGWSEEYALNNVLVVFDAPAHDTQGNG